MVENILCGKTEDTGPNHKTFGESVSLDPTVVSYVETERIKLDQFSNMYLLSS